jgi:PAS domain-containing protein
LLFTRFTTMEQRSEVRSELSSSTTVDALARGRQILLGRASQVIGDAAYDTGSDVQMMAALLTASLEELKVAEEELREQTHRLEQQRAAADGRLSYYQALFGELPVPALVTDLRATILESNSEAARLFRRQARRLQRKPLAALVDPAGRDEFRRHLNQLAEVDGPVRCSIAINHPGEEPASLDATVKRIPGLGSPHSEMLFWVFEPTPER